MENLEIVFKNINAIEMPHFLLKVLLGFEPAEDADMKILEIQKEGFILYETYWDGDLLIPSKIYTCVKRMVSENKISHKFYKNA